MTGLQRLPRWLRAGLLAGIPLALGVFTTIIIGDRLQQNCSATLHLSPIASWALITVPVTGAAIAGRWASQGMRAGYGCLAGLLFGLLVGAGVIAASMVDLELQVNCLTPPPQENLRPRFTSAVIQSAVSFALALAGLAGLAGLVAARYRRKRQSGEPS